MPCSSQNADLNKRAAILRPPEDSSCAGGQLVRREGKAVWPQPAALGSQGPRGTILNPKGGARKNGSILGSIASRNSKTYYYRKARLGPFSRNGITLIHGGGCSRIIRRLLILQVFRQCCLGTRLCSLGLSTSRGLFTIDPILSNVEVQVL